MVKIFINLENVLITYVKVLIKLFLFSFQIIIKHLKLINVVKFCSVEMYLFKYQCLVIFSDNKLSDISDDMFSQMPNLQTLGMRNNQISTLPESAFEGTGSKLEYLMLSGE